jgi:putative phage-type endonuclease
VSAAGAARSSWDGDERGRNSFLTGPGIKQHTPAWHEARRGRITASIAGAILGLNKYCSAKKAWRIIKGVEVEGSNEHIARGNRLEEPARKLYEVRHGVKVQEAGFVVHRQLPWLGSSPDGLVGPHGLLEIKCPQTLPDDAPAYHECQMRVQLACTDRQWADYFCFIGPGRIFEKRIVRDKVAERDMLLALKRWWVRYVLGNVEPPAKFRIKHVKGEE